jgi:hypothetical protein
MKYDLEPAKKYRIITHSKYEQKSNSVKLSIILAELKQKAELNLKVQ